MSRSSSSPSFSPPPTKPLASDCCGHDCAVCVFDLYDQELDIWEKECQKIAAAAADIGRPTNEPDEEYEREKSRSASPPLQPHGYKDFVILGTTVDDDDDDDAAGRQNDRVVVLHLEPVIRSIHPLRIELGQHVVVRVVESSSSREREIEDDESSDSATTWTMEKSAVANAVAFCRQLTPFDVTADSFRLMIKLKPGGRLSTTVAAHWRPGDVVALRGPYGGLPYRRNRYDEIYMLAMGVGVAPLLAYVETILADEEDETRVAFAVGARFYADICQKRKFDAWSAFWNFRVTYFLSGESEESLRRSKRYGERCRLGRLDRRSVEEFVFRPEGEGEGGNSSLEERRRRSIEVTRNEAIFIVGSPEFEYAVAETLRERQFQGQVFRFTSLST